MPVAIAQAKNKIICACNFRAIQGTSSTIIGNALGHRSQASTAIYARLTQDPVRQALEDAQKFIFAAGGIAKEESPKVVRLRKRKQ